MHWHNIRTAPNRWMAWYLKRQGWVVFYLDPIARHCGTAPPGCWLALYAAAEAHDGRQEGL